MKTLSAQGQAVISGHTVPMVVLVAMAFTVPVYLCTANIDLVVNGTTYLGTAGAGKISAVQNTAAEIKTLEFELAGPPQSLVSLAMSSSVQGTPVTISVAILDPSTYAVTDVVPIWAGALDTMHLDDSTDKSVITVSAEHLGIDLNRPAPLYYANDDQQALYPGDLFFEYTSKQFDQQIVWPNAWFFHKS